MTHVRHLAWILAAVILAACAPSHGGFSMSPPVLSPSTRTATGPGPITNVIFIVQADRSFNDLFATFAGADTALRGFTRANRIVALKARPLAAPRCAEDGYTSPAANFAIAYNGGKMNGWDSLDRSNPLCPYTYVRFSDTKPYWNLAKAFTISDKTFSSTHFGGFVDLQYMIAGSTRIAPGTYVIGQTTSLGCDAPAGTTSIVWHNGRIERNGPFPCFAYPTIANLLDARHVSWKWYAAPNSPWNPWEYNKYVRRGPDWKRNVSIPETNVLSDLKNGTLPSVSWVTPSLANSDFPVSRSSGGPAWVQSVVSAVQHSKYWSHAAIVVVWDDAGEGAFYDPVPPPEVSYFGPGFRVPLLAISPFARTGYVAHAVFQNGGSTLRFVEQNWKLGTLGTTDVSSTSVGELFSQ